MSVEANMGWTITSRRLVGLRGCVGGRGLMQWFSHRSVSGLSGGRGPYVVPLIEGLGWRRCSLLTPYWA